METELHVPPMIVLDADLVLLDYIEQFRLYMLEVHGIEHAVPWAQEPSYSMPNMYPSLARPIHSYFEEMGRDLRYFASIPHFPGAIAGVAAIRRLFPGAPIMCVTSCGLNSSSEEMRVANLADFALDGIHVLPMGGSKARLFETFPAGCWVVDDHPSHVEAAIAAGHRAILFDHMYNRHLETAHRARDWPEVLSIMAAASPDVAVTRTEAS